MNAGRNTPFVINCDDTQMKISQREYTVSQHQSGLGQAHLGFSALLMGKTDILIFSVAGTSRSLAIEWVGGRYMLFPNGRRDLACDISRWEIEAIDGLIVDCMLGRYAEEISIDTDLTNVYGRVSFVFVISDFFL